MSTFPAAPNDPFARALGSRAPASPFRVGDGPPPVLVGRDRLLAEAAEQLRAATEQRPTPILGLHGPAGIGKTSILDLIESEIVGRGGVVARLDGRYPASGLVQLANAHDRLLAATDSGGISAGRPTTIAATYRASAAMAAASKVPFAVLVDDLHAASNLTDDIASVQSASIDSPPAALIFAGVHDHARMSPMPTGIRSLEVGNLQPADAIEAIRRPLADRDVNVDDDLMKAAAARSGGLPLAAQAWGDELWRFAHQDSPATIAALQLRVDARLGRVYSAVWMGLSDAERHYVAGIANEFGGPVSAGEAAERAGYAASQNASPMRARLLDQGVLHSPEYGTLEVAIAGFGRWHARQTAGIGQPDPSARRTAATRDDYGLAAEDPLVYKPKPTTAT